MAESLVQLIKNNQVWLIYSNVPILTKNGLAQRVVIELLSPNRARILPVENPRQRGFKVAWNLKDKMYRQWTISGNRLVSFYLALAGVNIRKFNRMVTRANLPLHVVSRNPLTIDTSELVQFLENTTGKEIPFSEDLFPIRLEPHKRTPVEEARMWKLYLYVFSRKSSVEYSAYLRVPPSVLKKIEKALSKKHSPHSEKSVEVYGTQINKKLRIVIEFNKIPPTTKRTYAVSIDPALRLVADDWIDWAKRLETENSKTRLSIDVHPVEVKDTKIILDAEELKTSIAKAITQAVAQAS